MNDRLQNLLSDLEKIKAEFLGELDSWPESNLSTAPQGEWNSLQIIKHMMESERGILGYMTKKTSSGWEQIEPTNADHDRNSAALNARLISRDLLKIPSVLTEPDTSGSLAELKSTWAELRKQFLNFTSNLDEEFYHRQIFNQPAAGKINLYQTIEFMYNHILHHTYQLEKLKQFHAA